MIRVRNRTDTRRRSLAVGVATAVIATLTIGGCGTSSGNHSGTDSTRTYTVGILTDETGPAASGNKLSVDGVKAGTFYASREGITIKYVVADTATNPTTALTAARKLVTRDHVFAVIANSAMTFAAAQYLTANNVPVIGYAEDGREWFTSPNMFSVTGPMIDKEVTTTIGSFFKKEGVTSLASIGYSIAPQSQASALAYAESGQLQGIKVGYLNAQFPFGSTDVGPAVLAMKAAGVDGFYASVDPNTAFAFITALQQQGVHIKAALLPVGYGGDLIQAGPGARQAAQGVYFLLGYQPIEMQTAATKAFESDLKAAGVSGLPGLAHYNGYLATGLFVRAVKAAGTNPTPASLITALNSIHDWNGLGLFGDQKFDLAQHKITSGECVFVSQLEGDKFAPVRGALPICGQLTDKTVSLKS
ncbi:ABC transporter substrate-binding protein [Pseudofrankia inefficax]|uniref:Extracellular ligand-binding receptor n=1 Tax=Pseudofrankia inefficax (strain DSM 45817 / CECT 9037 / DDB 130130 / EuI1c) TaxID=298654 RepID=E3J6K9_PSEI1|nr:ABC transporter substrate-binding protein [Pseudofrankia inefficax]ADP80785.1 Extracellular ligand-binding receptor [Pseudofrankia inefficax]